MDKLISFKNSKVPIDYFFTKNHYLLLLLSLVVVVFFSMFLSRRRHKVQKISVFIVGLLLIILEGLRIFWRYNYLKTNAEDLSFTHVTDLNFFTLSLWISIPIILIAAIKKRKKTTVFGLDFVFSVSALAAMITLIYPAGINSNFEFFHCYNIMYALLRSLIIMLGLMFAFANWISTANFLDHWKGLVWLLLFGLICFAVGYTLDPQGNLFYINHCPIFESLGIHLVFPFHFIMLGVFLFVFQIIIYAPFRIHTHFKYRKIN